METRQMIKEESRGFHQIQEISHFFAEGKDLESFKKQVQRYMLC